MTYSEKSGVNTPLLTKNEKLYPVKVFGKVFSKYNLEAILDNIKSMVNIPVRVELQRIIEAAYLIVNTSPTNVMNETDCINCPHARLMAMMADLIDTQLGIAEQSMNRIIDEHEFRQFTAFPNVGYHITSFRLMVAKTRHLLQEAINKVKFHGDDFTLYANVTKFKLAAFIDETTAPFRLHQDATDKILDLRNTIEDCQSILSDKMMLGVILSSLLHTAFTHSRKPTVVLLWIHAIGENLSLSVKSEGKQLSANDIDNLYKSFNGSISLGGTLAPNLYLAKKCIEVLGGTIHILSEKYETAIQVKIPCLLK